MDYLAWNDAIGKRFFNSDRSGLRVFLYVTTDVVNEIGEPYGADLEDFLAAVKTGPPWNSRHGWSICQQALQSLEAWRDRNLDYPPYLAYLALFALADTIEVKGFSRASYYPGLRRLLGEVPAAGGYASFDKMYELWFDLEVWSNEDRHGELGIFRADILGNRPYVGLPKAQTILTDDERHKLPLLFAENGFEPASPPSDRELSHLLSFETHHYLLPHTKRLLDNHGSEESAAREMLLDAIFDELEEWDETVPLQGEMGERTRGPLGSLRLAMTLDRTARTIHLCLRCRSSREYPEEGLRFIGERGAEPLYCYEDWQGWSTPLYEAETRTRIFDASRLDWRIGLSLTDREHAWKASLSKRSVRVMVSAASFGFDGFVEESQIPQGRPFYLLAHKDHAEMLRTWGRDCCSGFSEVESVSGIPRGWRLYIIERMHSDNIIREVFQFLALPAIPRIRLHGGLKVRGNQYFAFALPQIEVTGVHGTVEVFCNGHPLEVSHETGLSTIPGEVRAHRFIIEARLDGEPIRRKTLYTVETLAWRDTVPTSHFDKFGGRINSETGESYVGPITQGVTSPEFRPEEFLPPGAGQLIYFIGRNPGEIVECTREAFQEDWKPIWAVAMNKGKGNAIYCGAVPSKEEPTSVPSADEKRRRLWREVLWHKRKRISFPSGRALHALWKEYKEAARYAR